MTTITNLSLDNTAELVNDMRDWLKDCQWEDMSEDDIDTLTDKELINAIKNHYDGGINQFISDQQY